MKRELRLTRKIKYVKGKDIPHVDAMSGFSFKNDEVDDTQELTACETINSVVFARTILDQELVVSEINFSTLFSRIKNRIKTENNCSQAELPFRKVADQPGMTNDIHLFKNTSEYRANRRSLG